MNSDEHSLTMSAVAELVLRRPEFDTQLDTDLSKLHLSAEDLRRLELFRGLICMIKHAFMWNRTPRIRKALKYSGSEIAFFSAYTRYTSLKDILEWDIDQRELAVLTFAQDASRLKSLGLAKAMGISGLAAHVLKANVPNNQSPPLLPMPLHLTCAYLRTNPSITTGFYDNDPRTSSWCNECQLKPGTVTVVYGVGEPIAIACESLARIVITSKEWVKASDIVNEFATPEFKSKVNLELLSSLVSHGIMHVEHRYA